MFMASNQERDGFDPMIRAELLMALRSFGISDQRILAAIEKIDRQKFVEGPVQRYALEDIALPIDCGQTTSAPSVIAAALVAADLDPRHKLLEIGTGSGYQTAILACLVKRVFTICLFADFYQIKPFFFRILPLKYKQAVVSSARDLMCGLQLGWYPL